MDLDLLALIPNDLCGELNSTAFGQTSGLEVRPFGPHVSRARGFLEQTDLHFTQSPTTKQGTGKANTIIGGLLEK